MDLNPNNSSICQELVAFFKTLTLDEVLSSRFDVEEEFKNNGREIECDNDNPRMYEGKHRHVHALDRSSCPLPPQRDVQRHPGAKIRKNSLNDSGNFGYCSMELKTQKSPSKSYVPIAWFSRKCGECVFCRNNGEMRDHYKSHTLKDGNGKVICPILRAYTCPICHVSGDMAHTVRYCPKNKNKEDYIPRAVNLRSFIKTSVGKRLTLP